MSSILAASAALLLLAALGQWALSLRLRDASIADVFWGANLSAVGLLSALLAPPSPRGAILAALSLAWGLRLTVHLARRWRAHGEEDRRYRAMREGWGERFGVASLFTVFLLQGALAWCVSLPLQAGAARGPSAPLGLLDLAGVVIFAAGLAFEAVADAQLTRFRADPSSRGQVMDLGLWRYTRHPNYFGDAVAWWGMGLVAAAAGAAWALLGPALMTFLLVRVSGVALLEKDIGARRPGYEDYVRRTSAFVPLPPRAPRPAVGPAPRA